MTNIDAQARRIIKSLKGNISITGVVNFLGTLGYDVIFFNETDRAEFSRQYDLKLNDTKAITYFGDTRIVFVDDELSGNDKLHLLLHECGHILLGHIDENQVHSIDKIKTENEAEVFVYSVLQQKQKSRRSISPVLVSSALAMSLSALVFCIYKKNKSGK